MAEVGSAYVSILPSAKGFGSKLGKEIGGPVASEGGKAGKAFGGTFARTSAGPIRSVIGLVRGPLVGAFAAVASVKVFSGFIADARESAKIGRLTEQVIKSTGGAAKISATQVGDLATAISNKTGVDDEAIQSGQNLLLTFKNVRNEAGRGNDIFSQTSQLMTDMSVAMGTDTKSSSILLGKALNDPVRGLTALQRVGVTFTDQQKAQIKTLVESGKTLDAQKIILKELGSEFGGAARAASDPMDRLKVTLGNIGERIGGVFLPALGAVSSFLADNLMPAMDKVGGVLGRTFGPVFKTAIDVVKLFVGTFTGKGADVDLGKWANPIIDFGARVRDIFDKAIGVIKGFFGVFTGNGSDALDQFSGPTMNRIIDAGSKARETFDKMGSIFRQVATFIGTQVVPAVIGLYGWLARNLVPVFTAIATVVVTKILPAIATLYSKIAAALLPAIQGLIARLSDNREHFQQVFNVIKTVVTVVAQLIGWIVQKLAPVLGVVLGGALKFVIATIGVTIGLIGGLIGAIGKISTAVTTAIGWIRRNWGLITAILTGPVGLAIRVIRQHFDGIVSFVKELPGRISRTASGMWDGIKDAFRSALNWIIDKWNRLEFKIPGFDPPGPGPKFPGFTLGVPDIPRLAEGGIVKARPGGIVAQIGEGRYDEAVIPLKDGRLGGDVSVTVHTAATDPYEVARATARELAWVVS